jgi:TIR domain
MWHFFIAYSTPDRAAAGALYRRLTQRRARVFLDTRELTPGTVWGPKLKAALAGSRITIVLISRHTGRAWYQQEEVAIAIALVRQKATAHQVMPVLLQGGRLRDVPYGLNRLTLVREDELGLDGIARALLASLKHARRPPGTTMLGHSVAMLDKLWSDMEPVLQDKQRRMPQEYRIRFTTEGSDLVLRERGKERVRITRGQFKRKLTSSQLEYVETLERSMEVNLAFWDREYPRRSLNRTSKAKVKRAVAAMAQDLNGVLKMLETADFWLDDHYESVRQIVADTLPRTGRG